MNNLKQGDRVRASFEGTVQLLGEKIIVVPDDSVVGIWESDLTNLEKIRPQLKLPNEPGSIVTYDPFKKGTHYQAVKMTDGQWIMFSGPSSNIGKRVLLLDNEVVSIDRVGVE